jgi:peptidoglycan/LPS O-acetylase OafA/YrhL
VSNESQTPSHSPFATILTANVLDFPTNQSSLYLWREEASFPGRVSVQAGTNIFFNLSGFLGAQKIPDEYSAGEF